MPVIIETFSSGPVGTNSYLVYDGDGNALVVDASQDVTGPITARATEVGATIGAIVITHPHWDHIGDAARLREVTGAPLYAHPLAVPRLEQPGTSSTLSLPPIPPVTPDHFLNEGDSFVIGYDEEFEIWHLPGHEPSHIVLYHPTQEIVLGGDVLFPNGHGRLDIPGADADQMRRSLARLAALPDLATVYPGHGLPTTIGAERSWLPTS